MKQEDKQLLLKDLSTRLLYGVKVQLSDEGGELTQTLYSITPTKVNSWSIEQVDVKPYLRPMLSMTEEEKEEFDNLYNWSCPNSKFLRTKIIDISELIDWLNAHHFDYRGLIGKGLAIEAPERMYNIKEK